MQQCMKSDISSTQGSRAVVPALRGHGHGHGHAGLWRAQVMRQGRGGGRAIAAIALQIAASGGWNADADVNGDRQITSLDALMILQAAAG